MILSPSRSTLQNLSRNWHRFFRAKPDKLPYTKKRAAPYQGATPGFFGVQMKFLISQVFRYCYVKGGAHAFNTFNSDTSTVKVYVLFNNR